VSAGIKKNGQPDLAVIVSDRDCAAAAVFTTNQVKAAPVLRGQRLISAYANRMRAVVVNSGCANACTGDQGLADAEETARLAAVALSDPAARPSGQTRAIDASQVFTMSTGVIGVHLPMDKLRAGLPAAVQALSAGGLEAAERAIMTTDTAPKAAGALLPAGGERRAIRIAGIAKGAGMIHPNMATMLAFVFTDAAVDPATLDACLRRAVGASFNRIVIDGDTSTNDTCLVLANGASGAAIATVAQREAFEGALTAVCASLAQQIVRDGEGATKFITLRVTGARDERMADAVGRSIARSPLVKTAFYGEDANWGRVVCAAGYSGQDVDPGRMALWFGPVKVFEDGMPTRYSEQEATAAIQGREIDVHLNLGLGQAEATLWTCDISHDYVTINGKYRT
jgi:glutamate N-acetyltransferase/amino-acid N-acetyltransferase